MRLSHSELLDFLEEKTKKYNTTSFIELDPISVPHRFSLKEDIEISGFIAATIAWGQRKTILNNMQLLTGWMDEAPFEFIMNCKKKTSVNFQALFTGPLTALIACISSKR